jgi:hypothetical protein
MPEVISMMMNNDEDPKEDHWAAEDDGMGFGVDVHVGEEAKEDAEAVDPETEGMGSDVEAPVEEEREL